ncbi:Glutathione S-transferase PARB [Vitis vinifera]|uniref:glutathione transferase n=1 Tax=Vitis vinifera TaxID=29760 RepID=A0A438F3J3_VITVI|nr:Glutathione S-transferase PARB [Vitis vinifera]
MEVNIILFLSGRLTRILLPSSFLKPLFYTSTVMAVRKVYGSLDSPATLKVLACLFEHHLDFEFVPVDISAGDNRRKPFLNMSPFGQVPVFEDGGYTQFGPQVRAPALELISELLTKPGNGLAPDLAVVAKAEAQLAKVLDVYEARLAEFKYLAADNYTIADVLHLPNLQALMETPAKKLIESRARVSAWCSEILARPAWAKVVEMKLKAHA